MRRFAALLTLALLTACAGKAPVGENAMDGGPTNEPRVSQASLEKWRSFPVNADPRPIVLLTDSPVRIEKGFTTGEAKLAFSAGILDPDGKLGVSGPKTVRVGAHDIPALSAAEAFAAMLTAEKQPVPVPSPAPIKVVSVKLGTAEFQTDRGPRELPAWIFDITDTLGPIAVLAFKNEWRSAATLGGTAKADGLTVTVRLPAAPDPCPGESPRPREAEVLESDTAVAVGLKPDTVARKDCPRRLMLRFADYTLRLSKPLGNRVLVDAQGGAMAVVTA